MIVASEIASVLGGIFQTQKTLATQLARAGKTDRAKKTKESDDSESLVADPKLPQLGADIEIGPIRLEVAQTLDTAIHDIKGDIQSLGVASRFTAEISSLFGKPDDQDTIAASLGDLARVFSEAAEQGVFQPDAIIDGVTAISSKFHALSERLQSLKDNATLELQDTLNKANCFLKEIVTLNHQIALGEIRGVRDQAKAAKRTALVEELAVLLDFAQFNRKDDSIVIRTRNGAVLLDGDAAELAFEGGERNGESAEKSEIVIKGKNVPAEIGAGALSGLLNVRNRLLPNLQAEIDTLAQTMQARLNQAGNRAIGDEATRSSYLGSHLFQFPLRQYFSLAGGDCVLSLKAMDGADIARTTVRSEIKSYRQKNGLPPADFWSIDDLARSIDCWLSDLFGKKPTSYAWINEDGRFAIDLDDKAFLSICDQRSQVLLSSFTAPSESSALKLSGTLAFSDANGNLFGPVTIDKKDSLASIALKLSSCDIDAIVLEQGDGARLKVESRQGTDLVIEPDSMGGTVASTLKMHPAPDAPREDVAVSWSAAQDAATFVSRPFANAETPLGLDGYLFLSGPDGSDASIRIDPSWNATQLTQNIPASPGIAGLTSGLAALGCRVAIRIMSASAIRISHNCPPGASATLINADFRALGGALTFFQNKKRIGEIEIAEGAGSDAIVALIQDKGAAFGVSARIRNDQQQFWLDVWSNDGHPLELKGSMTGTGRNRLNFCASAADLLALHPAAEQVITGFANFLGLNDLFIATPSSAFDSKAPTGVFTSTATPGTAGALSVNPAIVNKNGSHLDAGTMRRAAQILSTPMNIAAAGDLPRRQQTLEQYATTIIAAADQQNQIAQRQLVYNQALFSGLNSQRSGLPHIDIDGEIRQLGGYRQAYRDSSRVLSTLGQLFQAVAETHKEPPEAP